MKHRASLFVCLFASWASTAAAQAKDTGTLWQGTLGAQQIVVEQTGNFASTSNCGGTYFYRRHRTDIQLDGERSADGSCRMQELPIRWNRDTPKDQWRMRAPTEDRWEGEWIGTNGKSHPIRLSKVVTLPDAAEPSLTALRGDFDPYAYLRLSQLKLQRGKREHVNGYTLRWLRQPESGLSLFEVAAGYAPTQQAAINRTLHWRLWQWVDSEYQCRAGSEAGEAGFDTAEATLRHIDARVVSASLFTAYYCGGAHPDFGDSPVNIDARNGNELRLEDVLWLGQGDPVHQGENELDRAWSQYRQEIFAPWLVRQFAQLYPDRMGAPTVDDDCDYRDPDVWNYTDWYVLPGGIHLAAYFPRVQRNCDDPDWAVLPWSLVDAHPGPVRLH